jgi:hypothetical protein
VRYQTIRCATSRRCRGQQHVRHRDRLIDVGNADAIAGHRARDPDAFARWEPSRPTDFYTADGQRELLDDHRNGDRWPGVVLADGAVIGQVTVSTILGEPFRNGFLGYSIASTHQRQGHAIHAVGLPAALRGLPRSARGRKAARRRSRGDHERGPWAA